MSAPIIEAAEIVEKLSMRDDKTLRMTLFSLQKFIRVSFRPEWLLPMATLTGASILGRTIRERVPAERRVEGAY